tara:strand:- start:2015 stop:3199 length:1185 start_codon:yes stop_codon:yes gene_type:complete
MVLTHPFRCPTHVVEGCNYDEATAAVLNGRPWTLITSAGWHERDAVAALAARCGSPVAIIDGVEANPSISNVVSLAKEVHECDVIVALGGGSVLDASKGIIALCGLELDSAPLIQHLSEGSALPSSMPALPLIAIPTTSGTGSEVTQWGTIWGDDGIKFSVTDPKLRPSHAILDPRLSLSMPYALTLATGLDALSHAMESVWNRRHTAITDAISTAAIKLIWTHLEAALKSPDDIELRGHIQTASLMAGLAMGTTQTALAHSISYPFTARCGIPHGIACSFTLAEVARFNLATSAERLRPIAEGLGCDIYEIPETIERWYDKLGLGMEILKYVTPEITDGFKDNLITRARAANNVREIDGASAKLLARAALERICGTGSNQRAISAGNLARFNQ